MVEWLKANALWLIPAAPLLASIYIVAVGQFVRREKAHRPVVLALAISLIGALVLLSAVVPSTFGKDPHAAGQGSGHSDGAHHNEKPSEKDAGPQPGQKADSASSETGKAQTSSEVESQSEPAKTDAAKADPAPGEPGKSDSGKPAASATEPARAEPEKGDSAGRSSGRGLVVHTVSLRAGGEGGHAVTGGAVEYEVYQWFKTGTMDVSVTLRADAMSALMLVMVTSVSLLVCIFASSYMQGDPGYPRFFAALSLFVFSMCMLVLAGNFVLMFVFWEAVGLCSYLLIGYWFQKPSAAAAAKKAFVVNRIGDFGFILGIFLIWTTFGSVDFATVLNDPVLLQGILESQPEIITTICLLLFIGAIGKSAQFPLHVWLPDAMEGPTPVSALIHAATMVTAGVYLVARCSPLFVHAPKALMVVAAIGAATALIAAITALTQYDLKRVLAYSTVSQLGYMFMALGAAGADPPAMIQSAVTFAMFHMFTHAFFKAVLFLSAGSVMHAMGDVIDMRRFSGLRKALPITHVTFLAGALALAGFPLLSGFWSKDEILAVLYDASRSAEHGGFYTLILAVALLTSLLTAFYTFRAYFLTFWGPEVFPEEAGHHPHDAPPKMAGPLYLLALAALAIGLLTGPTHLYGHYLHHTPGLLAPEHAHEMNFLMMGVSIVLGLTGIGAAYAVYANHPGAAGVKDVTNPLTNLSLNGLYLDDLYLWLVVKPLRGLADLSFGFDRLFIDKLVDIVGLVPNLFGAVLRPIQNGVVQSYAFVMLVGLAACLVWMLQAMAGH